MIPDIVQFSDLDLNPRDIHAPRKHLDGPYPKGWVRHQFVDAEADWAAIRKIDRWLEQNISGRWGSYSTMTRRGVEYILYFENDFDAVMFRLKDGETAWKEEQ